jgi:hypothetical protein
MYGKGDQIKIETNVDQLWFRNETKNWQFKMKISLTEHEWRQAYFCVYLSGFGDSISILDKEKTIADLTRKKEINYSFSEWTSISIKLSNNNLTAVSVLSNTSKAFFACV